MSHSVKVFFPPGDDAVTLCLCTPSCKVCAEPVSVCSGKALAGLEIMNESQEFSLRVSEADLENIIQILSRRGKRCLEDDV